MNNFIELLEVQETAKTLSSPIDNSHPVKHELLIKSKILINLSHISLIIPHNFLTLKDEPDFNQNIMGDTITKITLVTEKTILVAESYKYISELIKKL